MPHTLLYFIALFSLSTSANWAKFNHMPAEVLGFYRLFFAFILLLVWKIFSDKKRLSFKLKKDLLWVMASTVFFFLHLWTYKYAAKHTSIANTVILFSSNPVWASLGAIVFFKESFHKRLLVSYALALTAVYLLVAHQFNLTQSFNHGDLSSVLSAVLYAAYMLTGKKARKHYENTAYALLLYGGGALLFLSCLPITEASLTGYSFSSWVAVAGLVFMPTFFGHFSLTYLVNYMDLSLMTCGKLVEPVFASLIAYFVFSEQLGPYAWISFFLTTLSVLILFAPALRKALKNT